MWRISGVINGVLVNALVEMVHEMAIRLLKRTTVEAVVKLSQKHIDHSIRVELDLDEFEETPSELRKKATYKEIRNYVFEKYGVKVTTLSISQIKRKCGLEVEDNFNPPKNEKYRQPQCTLKKEEMIMCALRQFKLI